MSLEEENYNLGDIMNLEKNDIITLDNEKEYVVLDTMIIDGDNFLYLVEKYNVNNHKLALVTEENGRLKINELDTDSNDNKEILSKIFENLVIDEYNYLLNERDSSSEV